MEITKSISSFIVGLLLVVAANVYGIDEGVFPIDLLPQDMQREVMVAMANNTISNLPQKPESLEIAAQEVRNLCLTNKELNNIINESNFTLKLIKNLAKRFHCSDYKVANALATRGAQGRITLQKELMDIMSGEDFSMDKFEDLCKRGVDLEFVDEFSGTPLNCAVIWAINPIITQALINKGINVDQIFEEENVLWRTIETMRHRRGRAFDIFLPIIKILLAAGADPKLPIQRTTILERAQQYGPQFQKVVELMQDAITKKHKRID